VHLQHTVTDINIVELTTIFYNIFNSNYKIIEVIRYFIKVFKLVLKKLKYSIKVNTVCFSYKLIISFFIKVITNCAVNSN
jgi:hypothetical protein